MDIMPCIQIKTNTKVNNEKAEALKTALGKTIENLPGKTEDWLMITLEDDCRIWFRGETGRPMAVIEVKVWGDHIDRAGSERMTAEICELFQKELGVSPKDLYVRYLASMDWGWNGGNF